VEAEKAGQLTCENSSLALNKSKNRYVNIVAYDHSRVVLRSIPGVLGSDFINANFVDVSRRLCGYLRLPVSQHAIPSAANYGNCPHSRASPHHLPGS
jgi:protein tyrosine phosphatase